MSSEFHDYDVNVDCPQKHFDPMETYVSFRITTKVKQEKDESEFVVRRRYNDFVWLRTKLIEAFPTLVVPALPAKHTVLEQLDRYSRPFIMTRMAMLHTYLQRLTSHPVFSCSPLLESFLQAQSLNEVIKQSKSSQGLLERLSGSFNTLSGLTVRNVHSPEFDHVKTYASSLMQKLTLFQEVSSRINRERSELGGDMDDAIRSILHWSYQEQELAPILRRIADTIKTVSHSHNNHILQTYSILVDQPLEEYVNYIEAVKEALCRRDMIQYNYESSYEESQRKRLEKVQLENEPRSFNGFGFKLWNVTTNQDKCRKLQQHIMNLDELVETNHDKMEIANEGIKSDLERWNLEKVSEIKTLFGRIAEEHVLYYEESLEAWEKASELLKGSSDK